MGQSIAKEQVSVVSAASAIAENTAEGSNTKPKCKACCACPETKKARDQCIMDNGEEKCGNFIEAHKKCMRDMGFNI